MRPDPARGQALTGAQTRMWISQHAESENPVWNMSFGWRLDGDLDQPALRRAVEGLLVWHPILGNTFREVDSVPRAFPAEGDERAFGWDLVDLSRTAPDEVEERTRRHLLEVARQPIDLSRGPLLRVTLVRERLDRHVFHMVVHHIVFDGRSQEIFARDLARIYSAAVAGDPLPAPPTTADEVGHEEADAEERALSLKYWTDTLRGIEPAELPTDCTGSVPEGAMGSHTIALGEDTFDRLRAVADDRRSTLFMTALAGLQIVLARFAGSADVVVGTPVSTRTSVEQDETIGVFFNPVLIHTQVDPRARVDSFLDQVRDATLHAFQHSGSPFNDVVAALNPVRSGDASPPMLQTWLEIHLDSEDSGLEMPGLAATPLEDAPPALRSHLDVTVLAGGAEPAVRLNYPADRFHAESVARLAAAFAAVLEELADGGSGTVGQLGRDDRNDAGLRATCIGPQRLDAGADFLTDVFHWSMEAPDQVAVTQADTSLTYGELLDRSRWVAERMCAHGIGAEDIVAIHMKRRPDLLVAMLGVMLSGGAYLPLDPDLPADRLRTIVEDAGPKVIITDLPEGEVASWVPEVVAAGDVGTASGAYQEYPGAQVDGHHLAYVMYTSGSTGRPKGVLIERAGLTNFVRWCAHGYDSGRPGGAPVFSSVSFDAVLPNLFGPLALGQPVHLLPADLDIGDLGAHLRDLGPFNYVKLTPQHLDVLATQLTADEASALCGRLVVGADTFPRSTLERWRALDPHTPILNEYGPTEITVANSTYDIEGLPVHDVLPIGRPIPGTTMWILDDELRPVPRGGVGEICIGGVGVARGYLGRPDATAAAFLPDPMSPERGARIYRTGDYGRVDVDGQVEFRGRRDHQIKVRGFRVEPAEVERALTSQPEIGAAHVAGFRTPEGNTDLIAYVVTLQPIEDRVLRRRLRDVLPAYLVPNRFVSVPEIPLTPHGKVDSRRLPQPEPLEPAAPSARAADGGLGAVWAEVLGVDRVGPHDNFFELGGHSLLALKLIARIEAVRGRKLSLKDVFEAPTVSAMEEQLYGAPRSPAALQGPARLDGSPRPITAEQARILYVQEASGSATQFNLVGSWSLTGPVDADALHEAVRRLLERHIALRTRIELRDGAFVQVLDDMDQVDIRYLDLSAWDAAAAEARVRQVATSLDRAAFTLGESLVRMRLVALGPEQHAVLIGAHHAVVDGWSMGLLVRDLGELYAAVVEGRDDRLPVLRAGYDDRTPRTSEATSAGRKGQEPPQIDALPPRLPVDRLGSDSATGDVVETLIDGANWAGACEVARAEGTTPFVVLLACVQTVIADFAASSSYSFGFSDAGRDDPDVHDVVGPFFRQAVAIADLSGDPTLREVVRRAGAGVLQARAGLENPSSRSRAAESAQRLWVEMEPGESEPAFPPDIGITELALPVGDVKNDLVFSMRERDSRVEVRLAYRSALFEPSTAERLLDELVRVVSVVHAVPDCRISDVSSRVPVDAATATSLSPSTRVTPRAAGRGAVDVFLSVATEVLGVADIGPEDNFFELGGDSIRALGFVAKLREQGLDITVRDLIGRATFTELAEAVTPTATAEPETRDSSLVHLRMAAGGRRLFCIHPSGGGVQWYFNLADVLPDGCGLSAFQALDGRWRDHAQVTVEEMAAVYADELCREADTGPYTILGWSASGVWAIEMARQLRARGVEVAPVILVEPAVPDLTGKAEIRRAWSDFSEAADLVDEIGREDLAPTEKSALRQQLVDLVARSGVLSDRVPEISTSGELRMAASLEIALLNYTPVPYDGPAVLVVGDEVTVADADHPSKVAGRSAEAYLDRWRSLFPPGAIQLHHVGGGHISIIQDRENAAQVAAVVTGCWEDERVSSGGAR